MAKGEDTPPYLHIGMYAGSAPNSALEWLGTCSRASLRNICTGGPAPLMLPPKHHMVDGQVPRSAAIAGPRRLRARGGPAPFSGVL